MKITDLIGQAGSTAFSFEVLPPLKGTGIEGLKRTIDRLREFDPKYINITTHRSEYVYKDLGDGLMQRLRLRRRPGTVAVAATIQNEYGIPVVPHILCSGFTREETEYVLLDLQFLGIENLLVLRGDKAKWDSSFQAEADGYSHTTELQEQINRFNAGEFVDGSPIKVPGKPFSYGVACYPEKHEEALNPDTDFAWFKKKIELGAEYGVTQLFYDNKDIQRRRFGIKFAKLFFCRRENRPISLLGEGGIQRGKEQNFGVVPVFLSIFQDFSQFFGIVLLGGVICKIAREIDNHIKIVGFKNSLNGRLSYAEKLYLIG